MEYSVWRCEWRCKNGAVDFGKSSLVQQKFVMDFDLDEEGFLAQLSELRERTLHRTGSGSGEDALVAASRDAALWDGLLSAALLSASRYPVKARVAVVAFLADFVKALAKSQSHSLCMCESCIFGELETWMVRACSCAVVGIML